ncbi:MAG: dienelactone hydrolase family protein [Vicinamibacterales bacterium]|jgi:predicted peptidase|nr:dienelactone hydrolase family protein [Vicinamibacterales bacterium]
MRWLLTTALLGTLMQAPFEAGLHNATINVDGVGGMTYGIWVPRDYDPATPVPLVLALHPGGSPGAGYGTQFLRGVVGPALQDWGAIIVSPDAPGRRWANETSERAVMALLDDVKDRYSIDTDRILVTGFSMGGRGTWYFASRHPDLFNAAIPMAARSDESDAARVGDMPVYIIHARDDEVVPFGPAEALARTMDDRGQTVAFLPLEGVGHFQMGAAPLQQAGEWVLERWAER